MYADISARIGLVVIKASSKTPNLGSLTVVLSQRPVWENYLGCNLLHCVLKSRRGERPCLEDHVAATA